jgi:hypothetical protein
MKGAREFATLIPSGQYGNLRIDSGRHARGYCFSIFIITPHGELEVYGIVSGQPGWTEEYGWLYHGPWELDFEKLVWEFRELQDEQTKKNLAEYKKKQKIEDERKIKILNSYGKPDITGESFETRCL